MPGMCLMTAVALTAAGGSCTRAGAQSGGRRMAASHSDEAERKVAEISPTPPASPTASASPDPVVVGGLFADKTLPAATPQNVRQKVAVVVPLKSEGPHEGRWTFSGDGNLKEVPWVTAQFEERKGRWQLSQLDMIFRPAGGTRVFFDTVVAHLRTKLGKPAEAKKAGPTSRRTEWRLRKDLFLSVEESVDADHGPGVEVDLYVPGGEPD